MKNPDLTILIPAYREEKRIGKTLDELAGFLKKDKFFKDINIEVMVVAADSPDRTIEIVWQKRKLFKNFKLLKPGERVGKGRDVKFGMLKARGKAIIFMDADLATPLRHLQKFYEAYQEGWDVIVGTRNLLKHHKSVMRRSLSNAGNLLFRFAGGVWIEDSQCGFKMFSNKAAKVCFSHLTILKWGFDMEILAIAKANKFKIKVFRINDWKHQPHGTFEDKVLQNAIHSLVDLGHIFRRRVRRQYKQNF